MSSGLRICCGIQFSGDMARFLLQEDQNSKERTCGDISTVNKYGFALAGSLVAIILSRSYVSLGGSLNFSFLGHELHHLYYGLSILVLLPILRKRGLSYQWIYFLFGFSLGLITDEFDLILSIGESYSLELYDNPVNIAMDLILVLVLFRLSQNHAYTHGFLVDTERSL